MAYEIPEDIQKLIDIYTKAQENLVKTIAEKEAKGSIATYQKSLSFQVLQILQNLDNEAKKWSKDVIPDYYQQGIDEAIQGLKDLDQNVNTSFNQIHQGAIQAIVNSCYGDLNDANNYVGRRIQDTIRQAGLDAVANKLATGQTVQECKKNIVNSLIDEGINAIKDKRGRNISLDAYASTVARTTTREATNTGTKNQLTSLGYDLVKMSSHATTCSLCSMYQGRVYSISGKNSDYPPLDTAFSGDHANIHPNCFVAGTLVSGPPLISHITRSYEGEIIVFRTSSGEELTVTPNHPILTPKGWVAVGLLNEGDEVIKYIGSERVSKPRNPDYIDVPIRIEDIPGTIFKSSSMTSSRVPVTSEDFHGDGSNSEICVIRSDCELWNKRNISFFEPRIKKFFNSTNKGGTGLLKFSSITKFIKGISLTFNGLMGRICKFNNFIFRHSLNSSFHSFTSVLSFWKTRFRKPKCNYSFINTKGFSDRFFSFARNIAFNNRFCIKLNSIFSRFVVYSRSKFRKINFSRPKMFFEGSFANADNVSDLLNCLSGYIERTNVVKIERRYFSGHVYNLQTKHNWYVANNIITHNCKHVISPYIKDLDDNADSLQEYSNRPFEIAEKDKKAIDDYNKQQAAKRQLRNDRNQYQEFKLRLGDDVPKNFGAFRQMKSSNSEKWQELTQLNKYLKNNPQSDKIYYNINNKIEQLRTEGTVKIKGVAVNPIPTEIKELNEHTLQRMNERSITKEDAQSFINNSVVAFKQRNGAQFSYYSEKGFTVITLNGEVGTTGRLDDKGKIIVEEVKKCVSGK